MNHQHQKWLALAIAAGATVTLGYTPSNSGMWMSLWGLRTMALVTLFRTFKDEAEIQQEEDAIAPEETIAQLQQQIVVLNQQLMQQRQVYQSQGRKLYQAFQQDKTALLSQQGQLQSQYQRLEQQAIALETQKRQLQLERAQMQDWAEKQSEQITNQQKEAQEAIAAKEQQIEKRLLAERESILENLKAQWEQLQEKQRAEIEARDQMIEDMERRLKDVMLHAHSLQMPDTTEGMTTEELHADRVIDYLYSHGVIVKSPQVKPLGNFKFELAFKVLAIAPGAQEQKGKWATSLLDAYKRIQDKLADGIPGVVPGCKTRPSVDIRNQRLALKIDTSGVDWVEQARIAEQVEIVEADPNWLLEIAEIGNHFRITGPTDTGKSILADNLVGALRQVFQTLTLTTADPKYPFTEWTTFTPQYKGIDECFSGVFKLEKLIISRFAKARKAVDVGLPLPEFEPELFALDEAEILVDEARSLDDANPPSRGQIKLQKQITRALRKGLKLGRGLTKKRGKGLKVLYIAQSPLCSRLGFHRDDLDQSVNIFIGENIPRALQEELKGKISSEQRDYWLEQYHLRLERGDRYFCLVKLPASGGKKSLFLATMPKPGTYAVEGIQQTELAEPEQLDEDALKYLAEAEITDDVEDDDENVNEDSEDGDFTTLERNRLEFAYQLEPESTQQIDFSAIPTQGLELLSYVCGRGSRHADAEGWFAVDKLRSNWGKDRGIQTEALKTLLRQLNEHRMGEFRAGGEKQWRPTISPEFLPQSE